MNGPGDTEVELDAPKVRVGDVARQALVLLTVLATIAFNALAVLLPLMGRTPGEISAAYPAPFTPAGYVFSIWSAIYLGLIVFGIWQALPSQSAEPRLRAVAPWVVLTGAFNVAWLVAWHAERVALAVLPIAGLLLSLVMVYEGLRDEASRDSPGMRFAARLPFAIYLGWITVATIANLSVAAWAFGWRGAPFGPEVSALVMVAVAAAIGLRVLQVRGDVAYASVLVWAFIGIAVNAGLPSLLAFGSLACAALVLGGAVGRLARGAREVRR